MNTTITPFGSLPLLALCLACSGATLQCDPTPSLRHSPRAADAGLPGTSYAGPLQGLTLGQHHGCVIYDDDDARCWGDNTANALSAIYQPEPGEGLGYEGWEDEAHLATGAAHTCAVSEAGVHCWGDNRWGQLGLEDAAPGLNQPSTPLAFPRLGAGGLGHHCIADESTVVCWGHNGHGQLGRNTTDPCCAEAAEVALPEGRVEDLAAGFVHSCALLDGQVWCWGDLRFGAAGTGSPASPWQAQHIPLAAAAIDIAAGAHHTCALLESGAVDCWGRNTDGELGSPGPHTASPRRVPLPFAAAHLSAGGTVALPEVELPLSIEGTGRSCAVSAAGEAHCWGNNALGQLGDGTTEGRPAPTPIAADLAFVELALGGQATCGRTVDDHLWCWGEGALLGSPNTTQTSIPRATTVFEFQQ